jgi:hypothetical protein
MLFGVFFVLYFIKSGKLKILVIKKTNKTQNSGAISTLLQSWFDFDIDFPEQSRLKWRGICFNACSSLFCSKFGENGKGQRGEFCARNAKSNTYDG